MKRFLLQISLFSIIITAIFGIILSLADGNTDPFYIRFTTPKQENLILGTSRAAQGLQPKVFNEICNKNFTNYSFTVAHSPYGKVYLNSIKKKIKENTKNGIYIVTVDPWSISSQTKDPNDLNKFRENKLCVATTQYVDYNPNFFYLIENLNGKYLDIFTKKNNSKIFLHNDGWLEVSPSMDSNETIKRITSKIEDYRKNNLPSYKYSSLRFQYLKNLIEFLNKNGSVYIVRLPIHPSMMNIEDELMPNFNNKIDELTLQSKGYLDMTPLNNKFIYTDGNHLYKDSGEEVSKIIAQWIINNK